MTTRPAKPTSSPVKPQAPAEVAAAWAGPGPGPRRCEESLPAGGPLPEALAAAVAVGDLNAASAARLAAY